MEARAEAWPRWRVTMLIDDVRDVVVGVGKGISISVPIARVREIQGIQGLVRVARNSSRCISLANFAIRSILVRRTRIERAVDY